MADTGALMPRRRAAVCTEPGCPWLATNHGRCLAHGGDHTGWSPGRDRAAQQRFRDAVLERDQFTCVGCGHRDPSGRTLRAAHLTPIAAGGGYHLSEGVTRCVDCDRATDPHAR